MKRSEILEAARRCVCGEREQDYGTPENNFETIGLLWGVYLRAAHPEFATALEQAKAAGVRVAHRRRHNQHNNKIENRFRDKCQVTPDAQHTARNDRECSRVSFSLVSW